MTRSLKKGKPFVFYKLEKKIKKQIKEDNVGKKVIRTWSRSSEIQDYFVGCKIEIHDGRYFVVREIKKEMIGMKLGELAPTTRFYAGINHKRIKKAKK